MLALVLLVALATSLIIIGLFWVALLIFCMALFGFPFWKGKAYARILAGVILLFIISLSLRLFFVEIYAIPSSSMESTLVPGDKILVNKLAYGPVLPGIRYRRLSGYTQIHEGDVVSFVKHEGERTPYVKRCVAGPGRELVVKNGIPLHLEAQASLNSVLLPIAVWTHNPVNISRRLDALQIDVGPTDYSPGGERAVDFQFRTTLPVIHEIKTWASVDSVKMRDEVGPVKSFYLTSIDSTWTIYDFGPLRVPVKGMELTLSDSTVNIYGSIIREFEKAPIEKKDDGFWLNGRRIKTYTFQQNYYFMLGDNREDSNDSRYNGFVPERNIIGKVGWVLFSNSMDGFNWDRVMVNVR